MELYLNVEYALCNVLRKHNYHSIGHAALEIGEKYPQYSWVPTLPPNPLYNNEDDDDETDNYFFDRAGVFFLTPLWDLSAWAGCFSKVFKVDYTSIRKDLQKLFSLSFRIESRQSKKKKM